MCVFKAVNQKDKLWCGCFMPSVAHASSKMHTSNSCLCCLCNAMSQLQIHKRYQAAGVLEMQVQQDIHLMWVVMLTTASSFVQVVTYLLVVIYKAAPVQQVHHGLEAEDGLPGQAGVVRHHGGPCLQLDRLICLCPGKLLQPHLHAVHTQWCRGNCICYNLPYGFYPQTSDHSLFGFETYVAASRPAGNTPTCTYLTCSSAASLQLDKLACLCPADWFCHNCSHCTSSNARPQADHDIKVQNFVISAAVQNCSFSNQRM